MKIQNKILTMLLVSFLCLPSYVLELKPKKYSYIDILEEILFPKAYADLKQSSASVVTGTTGSSQTHSILHTNQGSTDKRVVKNNSDTNHKSKTTNFNRTNKKRRSLSSSEEDNGLIPNLGREYLACKIKKINPAITCLSSNKGCWQKVWRNNPNRSEIKLSEQMKEASPVKKNSHRYNLLIDQKIAELRHKISVLKMSFDVTDMLNRTQLKDKAQEKKNREMIGTPWYTEAEDITLITPEDIKEKNDDCSKEILPDS